MEMEKCLIPECQREARLRGLCRACYNSANDAVKEGKVPSWEFLVENGLAKNPANRNVAPFTKTLDAVLSKLNRQPVSEVLKKAESHGPKTHQ